MLLINLPCLYTALNASAHPAMTSRRITARRLEQRLSTNLTAQILQHTNTRPYVQPSTNQKHQNPKHKFRQSTACPS